MQKLWTKAHFFAQYAHTSLAEALNMPNSMIDSYFNSDQWEKHKQSIEREHELKYKLISEVMGANARLGYLLKRPPVIINK